METLSEAVHKALKRRYCPCMRACEVAITKDFFNRICNSEAYINCHNFARKMGELITPMSWLQRLAVEEDKDVINAIDNRESNLKQFIK